MNGIALLTRNRWFSDVAKFYPKVPSSNISTLLTVNCLSYSFPSLLYPESLSGTFPSARNLLTSALVYIKTLLSSLHPP